MGGRAILQHGFAEKRLDSAEHARLSRDVEKTLLTLFPGRQVDAVPSYAQKPDHGDLDVLLERDGLPDDYPQQVQQALGSSLALRNGAVTSYEVNGFQVDVITAPSAEYVFSLKYFSYNDLGNLIGRIAHNLGFKFGHDGLFYVVRSPAAETHLLGEIMLTQNFSEALEFLGLSCVRFEQGFDTLEDVFTYVASSRYFQPDFYPLETRSHRARVRDAKRKTYRAFLRCVNNYPAGLTQTREQALTRAQAFFQDFAPQHVALMTRYMRRQKVRARFNGQRVADVTGLQGKALGKHMRQIGRRFPHPDDLDDFVLQADEETLIRFMRGEDASGA